VSGVSKAPHYKMMGLTADTLDTGNYFSGCAGDIYPLQGGTFEAINSVSINGHSNSSGQNNPFNNMAGAGTISNNAVYVNRTSAGVADETYIPQTGSPLIGAGIADEDFTEDYYGIERPNPPSIGAAEPDSNNVNFKQLTVNVEGVDDIDLLYNSEIQPNSTLLFPTNTLVENIGLEATGYVFTPASQSVLMDEDKTITFIASEE